VRVEQAVELLGELRLDLGVVGGQALVGGAQTVGRQERAPRARKP
jgi:hypothetical protein